FENGRIFVKGAPAKGKSFAEVANYAYIPVPLPKGLEPGLSEEAFFEPSNNTYPFGCHISMLEIDRDTGEPKLLRLVAVDDAGHLINPLIVAGQIPGARGPGPGDRSGHDRRGGLQLRRSAGHRIVHGLRAAARHRLSTIRARQHGDADASEAAWRHRRWRGVPARV